MLQKGSSSSTGLNVGRLQAIMNKIRIYLPVRSFPAVDHVPTIAGKVGTRLVTCRDLYEIHPIAFLTRKSRTRAWPL